MSKVKHIPYDIESNWWLFYIFHFPFSFCSSYSVCLCIVKVTDELIIRWKLNIDGYKSLQSKHLN